MMQFLALDPLSFFTDILGELGGVCCGSIFIVGIVTAAALFLYFKKKRK